MTPMLEAQLEAYFRQRVRNALGGRLVKLAPTERGVPDRLVMLPAGRLYLVELKRVGGRVSPIQAHWHDEAAKIGHTVVVLTGRDEIDAWVAARAREFDPPVGRAGRPRKRAAPVLVYGRTVYIGDNDLRGPVVQHALCPECRGPVVYTGNYYCGELAFERAPRCTWALDSNDTSVANRRLAAELYQHYMRSTGREPDTDTLDDIMARSPR